MGGKPRRSPLSPSSAASERIAPIVGALARAYPHARTALRYRTPYELLVATILSAQCTDETVNRVTPALFSRYPDPAALAAASPEQVEPMIRPTGFYHNKARAIVGCARALCERFGGVVPLRLDDLVALPGVARKTANVLLANVAPQPESDHGIFVDTHVRRTSRRLALTDEEDPDRIERDLMRLVPKQMWADLPHQLVLLGRGPCRARNPAHADCPLLPWCPTGAAELGVGRAITAGQRGSPARAPRARARTARDRRE